MTENETITDSMDISLSELRELVMDREACLLRFMGLGKPIEMGAGGDGRAGKETLPLREGRNTCWAQQCIWRRGGTPGARPRFTVSA